MLSILKRSLRFWLSTYYYEYNCYLSISTSKCAVYTYRIGSIWNTSQEEEEEEEEQQQQQQEQQQLLNS